MRNVILKASNNKDDLMSVLITKIRSFCAVELTKERGKINRVERKERKICKIFKIFHEPELKISISLTARTTVNCKLKVSSSNPGIEETKKKEGKKEKS